MNQGSKAPEELKDKIVDARYRVNLSFRQTLNDPGFRFLQEAFERSMGDDDSYLDDLLNLYARLEEAASPLP